MLVVKRKKSVEDVFDFRPIDRLIDEFGNILQINIE